MKTNPKKVTIISQEVLKKCPKIPQKVSKYSAYTTLTLVDARKNITNKNEFKKKSRKQFYRNQFS